MSGARRALFVIGIVLIILLTSVGTYFGLVALGFFEKDKHEIDYNVDVQYKVLQNNTTLIGGNYSRRGDLLEGHTENISIEKLEDKNEIVFVVKIVDSNGIDVTNSYDISSSIKYYEVDKIELNVDKTYSPEYNGKKSENYLNVVNLEKGYFIVDGNTIVSHVSISDDFTIDVNAIVLSKFGEDYSEHYQLNGCPFESIISKRYVKVKLFYDQISELSSYLIVEGSFVEGETVEIQYYGFNDSYFVRIYDEFGVETTSLYNIEVVL